jgi:DNA-binding NtrC family response regulator
VTEPATAALIGRSAAIRALSDAVIAAARGGQHVRLFGEDGMGRRSIARALHQASARTKAGFATVPCRGLPPLLLRSALLGHERGAFPGAYSDRVGALKALVGGTLYLEEVGALDERLQEAITLMLEEGPGPVIVSSSSPAAGQRDQNRGLGDDLNERLSAVTLRLTPLRERREDIEPLAHHYLDEVGRLLRIRSPRMAPETSAALHRHDWPGNIRELRNTVELGLLRATDGLVTPDLLPAAVRMDRDPSASLHSLPGERPRPVRASWQPPVYRRGRRSHR